MKKIHITSLLAVGALFMAACGGKSSSASSNAGGGAVPPEQQGVPVTIADAETILNDGAAKIESGEVVLPDVFSASASYLSTRNGASQGTSQVVSINKNEKRYYAGRSYSDGTSEEYWIFPANGGLYGYAVSGGRSQCVPVSESDFDYSLDTALEQAEKNIEDVYEEVAYYVGQVDAMVAGGFAPVYSVSSLGAGHLYFTFTVTMPIDGAGTLGTMSAEGLFVNYLPVMLNASQVSGTEAYSTQMTFAAGTETFVLPAGVTCPAGSSQSSQPSSSQPSTGNMTRAEAHALTQNYRDLGYTSCHGEGYVESNGRRDTINDDLSGSEIENYHLTYDSFENLIQSQEGPLGEGAAIFTYNSVNGYLTVTTEGDTVYGGAQTHVVTLAIYDDNGYCLKMHAEMYMTYDTMTNSMVEDVDITWGHSGEPSSSSSSYQPVGGNISREEARALTQNYRDAGYTSCHADGYMSTNGSRQTFSEDIEPENLDNYRLSYGNFEDTVQSQEQPTGTGSAVFNYDSNTGYLTISTDGEGSVQGTPVYVVTRAVYDANGYVVEMYAEMQVTYEGQKVTAIQYSVFTWGK